MPTQHPGLAAPVEASAVLLRGSQPSRILAVCGYEPNPSLGYGTLILHNGSDRLVFQNAASCSYHLRQGYDRGRVHLSVNFLDRRWKWRFTAVSSRFNIRVPDCSIRFSAKHPAYRRNAREIFAWLFAAVGEVNPIMVQAPANVYPRCEWEDTPADVALDELCRVTHCSLVLGEDNRIRVVALGVGEKLQNTARKVTASTNVRLGAVPSEVSIMCAPTLFQSKLLLEAVGLDTDGSIRPVGKLSYRPAAGWGRQHPYSFPEVDQASRHLAYQTVWRWYRVKSQTNGKLQIPGYGAVVDSADQYRLTPWLMESGDNDGMPCPLPARIWGKYFPQQDFPENTPKKAPGPSAFRILPELGIVEFASPIYMHDGSGEIAEPSLFLECGYHLAERSGAGFHKYSRTIDTGFPTNTNPFVISHSELWETHLVKYGADGVTVAGSVNNRADIDPEINEYLTRAMKMVQGTQQATDIIYGGLPQPQLDGLRAQAVAEYGIDFPPSMRVSQGVEHDVFTHDEPTRRRIT